MSIGCHASGLRDASGRRFACVGVAVAAFVFVCCAGTVLAGCKPTGPVVAVSVIDPARGNPAASGLYDRILVDLEIAGMTQRYEAPISKGTFELPIVFDALDVRQRFAVTLVGASDTVYGTAPSFVPADAGGLIRVVVLHGGSCALVSGVTLDAPVRSAGLARLDTFLLTVGGVVSTGDRTGAQFLDLLRVEVGASSDAGGALGASTAAGLGPLAALALGAPQGGAGAIVHFDFTVDPVKTTALTLHPGARVGASLVRVGDRALVAGGVFNAVPVAQATWVDAARLTTTLNLQGARRAPALAAVGTDAWVAGGSSTAPALERMNASGSTPLVAAASGEQRYGAWLAVDDASGRALLFGGVDDLGQPRTDSVLFSGCPASCTASAGPAWPNARLGASFVPGARLIVGGAGPSDLVERVVFAAADVHFEAAAQLAAARTQAATELLEGGLLWVVGGEGTAGLRNDVELCFLGP